MVRFIFTFIMFPEQQPDKHKLFVRATTRQRAGSAAVFLIIAGGFVFLWLAAHFHLTLYPFPCGFKQRFGLPCPTCGMTTAALAFAGGNIFRAFYIQPAAAFFCVILALTAFFSFVTAVFGIYYPVFTGLPGKLGARYIIIGTVIVLVAGWAVTLARAIAGQAG